jgi:hypothetical protein
MQAALLPGLFVIGFVLVGTSVEEFLINTLLLLVVLSIVGLWLSNRTAHRLGDRKLKILGSFWLVKVLATLTLLYAGWIPQLDPSTSSSWGYDPQRYYQYSWDLVLQSWNPVGLEQNFQGIIYYYGAIFAILGRNPVIPALVNAFVTLLGTLFLIRCAYQSMPNRTTADWRIAYLVLIPEVLWYDVMTSRESLMAVLLIISTIASGQYLVGVGRISMKTTVILVSGALVAILAVRTTMVLPVLGATVIMAMLFRSRGPMGPFIKFAPLLLGIAALMAGPVIQKITGGYDLDYIVILERIQGGEEIRAEDEWKSNSIGLLLMPSGLLQSVAFIPPRMVLYLVAPLPIIDISAAELATGSWGAWQRLMTLLTSVMMLAGFPYVLAGSALSWRLRETYPALLIIPIAFWVNFVAVVGGNTIIHERYRLMATLLLFATAWIGYTRCSPNMIRSWLVSWLGLLGAGAIFYIIYKNW